MMLRNTPELHKLIVPATAVVLSIGSLLLAGCEAPAGTRSVGRVMSRWVEDEQGTKYNLYPNNRARLPLVESRHITRFVVEIQDCNTMTPPPAAIDPTCDVLKLTFHDVDAYNQYHEDQLLQMNRDRVIGTIATTLSPRE